MSLEWKAGSMVSPYLLQPLRSFEEVELRREIRKTPHLDDETIVRRAFYQAKSEGQGPLTQIDRALTAVLAKNPSMPAMEALEIVNRIRLQAIGSAHQGWISAHSTIDPLKLV